MTQSAALQLQSLLTLGLVSDEQYRRALSSDLPGELEANATPADALFGLVARGIVTEDEVDRQADELARPSAAGPANAEKLAVLSEVRDSIVAVVRSVNAPHMEALLSLGLIDAEQHEAGCGLRPQRVEGVIDSPGRALAVLVNRGIVTEAQFEALKAQSAESAGGQAQHQERNDIVDEAARITHDIVGQYVKAMAGGAFRTFGVIMFVLFSVIGLAVWLLK